MAIVKETQHNILTLSYKQEQADEDYGSCLWAEFVFDLDAYSLAIRSDCGSYHYSWWPTPDSESFMHLMGRMNEDYLLDKLGDKTCLDLEGTKNNAVKAIYRRLENVLDPDKLDCVADELRSDLASACSELDVYNAFAMHVTMHGARASAEDMYYFIEKTYPQSAVKIVEIFIKYIKPICQKKGER